MRAEPDGILANLDKPARAKGCAHSWVLLEMVLDDAEPAFAGARVICLRCGWSPLLTDRRYLRDQEREKKPRCAV